MSESQKPALKPALERGSIKHKATAEFEFELCADFSRFSSGTIMLSATEATFQSPDTKEDGRVSVDLGGTVIQVEFGGRKWRTSITQVVSAAWEADKTYRQAAAEPTTTVPVE